MTCLTCLCFGYLILHLFPFAVKFLTNPKIASSSSAQKTKFLKDKGLAQNEIDTAMAQARLSAPAGTLATSNGGTYTPANNNNNNNNMMMAGIGGNSINGGEGGGQGAQVWGWKEYFIAATVMTGAVVVAKDYVLPKLQGYVWVCVCVFECVSVSLYTWHGGNRIACDHCRGVCVFCLRR